MHSAMFGLKRGYYAALRWGRRVLEGFAVTPARFDLMFVLRENRGWHVQSELRRILGVAGSTVSRMVKSLEGLGLVKREPASHDRRERIVSLTAEGEKKVDEVAKATMETGCAEVAMARAALGEARKKGWTLKRGMAAVVSLEEGLVRVRRGFRDGAQLVYVHCPYAKGWLPKRRRELRLLYKNRLAEGGQAEGGVAKGGKAKKATVEELPDWPGGGLPEELPTISEPWDVVVTKEEVLARFGMTADSRSGSADEGVGSTGAANGDAGEREHDRPEAAWVEEARGGGDG